MRIEINNLKKSFGDKKVFDSFNSVIEDGTTVLVRGASGCGKSTLIRILSGLDKDYKGSVTPSEFSVSVAFQEPLLYPGCDVLKNLETVSEKEKCISVLKDMNFEENAFHLFPDELSGGMAKKISVARALLYKADLYLIDEPFAGLDSNSIAILINVFKKYLKGKTAVIVSHIYDVSWDLFDSIIDLN